MEWVPNTPATSTPTATASPPAAVSANLRGLKIEKSFGLMGGCKVKIENGYIEIKGAPMNARAKIPIEAVEYAVVQRAMSGTAVKGGLPQLVLFGHGNELGHADLPMLKRKAGEQAAEWINELLRQHRAP